MFRNTMRLQAFLLSAVAILAVTRAQKCDTTFEGAAAKDPNLGLLSTAITSLSGGAQVIPSPDTNITVLAPSDNAFLAMLKSQNLSLGDLATFQDKVTAVLLQSIILDSYDIKALATAKDLPSALSSVEGKPFPLTFGKNGSSVTVKAKGNTMAADIIKSTKVCSSWLHNVDIVMLPTAKLKSAPNVTAAQLAKLTGAGAPAPAPSPLASGPLAPGPLAPGPLAPGPAGSSGSVAAANPAGSPSAGPTPAPTSGASRGATIAALPALAAALAAAVFART